MLMTVLMQTIQQEAGLPPERDVLERLLSGVAAGNRDCLAQLYHSTRGAVYGLALSYLKNAHTAQDVTQDAFVKIWEAAPNYTAQGSPMAWIMTITRNLALMELRQRKKTVELGEDEWNAIPAEAPAVTPEDRQILQQALAAISDEERKIVLLHAVSGLKHREIAGVLELPLSTVLSKYHRALKKMRTQLEGDGT